MTSGVYHTLGEKNPTSLKDHSVFSRCLHEESDFVVLLLSQYIPHLADHRIIESFIPGYQIASTFPLPLASSAAFEAAWRLSNLLSDCLGLQGSKPQSHPSLVRTDV